MSCTDTSQFIFTNNDSTWNQLYPTQNYIDPIIVNLLEEIKILIDDIRKLLYERSTRSRKPNRKRTRTASNRKKSKNKRNK